MEKKPLRKLTKHHVFMIIYGVIALSAVAVFWIFKENPISTIYDMAVLWLALPIGSMVVSYSMSIERGPKGLTWLLPIVFGASMSAVEFLTLSMAEIVEGGEKMPSITLLLIGAFASLVGFTFAKQDRVEKERAERAKKKKEAKAAAKAGKSLEVVETDVLDVAQEAAKTVVHEDDYNPGADFIPDENDTWADEVLEREGYGKEQVEYAQSDADFSIDMPDGDAAENIAEYAVEPAEEVEKVAEFAEEAEIEPEIIEENGAEIELEESSEDKENEETHEASEDEEAEIFEEHEACETDDQEVVLADEPYEEEIDSEDLLDESGNANEEV